MMESHLSNIKVVIFDIGKTVFDKDKQEVISKVFIQTIEKLKTKNIKVGCCTMRSYQWCKKMIEVPLDFYICLNGSYVVFNDKLIINKRTDYKNFDLENTILYGSRNCYYLNKTLKVNLNKNGFVMSKKGIIKKPYVISLCNVEEECIKHYKNKYTVYYWPKTKMLHLQNKNTSNLIAIKHIMNLLNLDKYLYFGDGPNDLDIFKANPYSFLVTNGDPNLKKYAYAICPSCLDDGVAKCLNEIYLKNEEIDHKNY